MCRKKFLDHSVIESYWSECRRKSLVVVSQLHVLYATASEHRFVSDSDRILSTLAVDSLVSQRRHLKSAFNIVRLSRCFACRQRALDDELTGVDVPIKQDRTRRLLLIKQCSIPASLHHASRDALQARCSLHPHPLSCRSRARKSTSALGNCFARN